MGVSRSVFSAKTTIIQATVIVHKDPESRKNFGRKQFKCFLCLKGGGHRSYECKSKIKCSFCTGKHHAAICSNKLPKEVVKGEQLLNLEASSWVGSACSGNAVALQTALASVEGKDGRSVREVFDYRSQKSVISAGAVEHLGLVPVSRETLTIQSFGSGQPERDPGLLKYRKGR